MREREREREREGGYARVYTCAQTKQLDSQEGNQCHQGHIVHQRRHHVVHHIYHEDVTVHHGARLRIVRFSDNC